MKNKMWESVSVPKVNRVVCCRAKEDWQNGNILQFRVIIACGSLQILQMQIVLCSRSHSFYCQCFVNRNNLRLTEFMSTVLSAANVNKIPAFFRSVYKFQNSVSQFSCQKMLPMIWVDHTQSLAPLFQVGMGIALLSWLQFFWKPLWLGS